jgi:hypothetical protein
MTRADALLLIRDELDKATEAFGAMAARFLVDMTHPMELDGESE